MLLRYALVWKLFSGKVFCAGEGHDIFVYGQWEGQAIYGHCPGGSHYFVRFIWNLHLPYPGNLWPIPEYDTELIKKTSVLSNTFTDTKRLSISLVSTIKHKLRF